MLKSEESEEEEESNMPKLDGVKMRRRPFQVYSDEEDEEIDVDDIELCQDEYHQNKKKKMESFTPAPWSNVFKEKNIVCGACGQHGHMRTNKNCPRYREKEESCFSYKSPDMGPVADIDDEATFLAMARDSVRVTALTNRLVDSLRLKVEKAKAEKLEAERALQAAGEASEIRQELELERKKCSQLSKDLITVREKSSEYKRKWAKSHWESDKLKKENEELKKEKEELKKESEELKKENEELKNKNHRLVVELDRAQVTFEGSLQEMKVMEDKLASSVKRLKASRDKRVDKG